MTTTKLKGIALATAAASLFSTVPTTATAASQKNNIHCYAVNACKGKGSCASKTNNCAGQNSCKHASFVLVPPKACKQLGGKIRRVGR